MRNDSVIQSQSMQYSTGQNESLDKLMAFTKLKKKDNIVNCRIKRTSQITVMCGHWLLI